MIKATEDGWEVFWCPSCGATRKDLGILWAALIFAVVGSVLAAYFWH